MDHMVSPVPLMRMSPFPLQHGVASLLFAVLWVVAITPWVTAGSPVADSASAGGPSEGTQRHVADAVPADAASDAGMRLIRAASGLMRLHGDALGGLGELAMPFLASALADPSADAEVPGGDPESFDAGKVLRALRDLGQQGRLVMKHVRSLREIMALKR